MNAFSNKGINPSRAIKESFVSEEEVLLSWYTFLLRGTVVTKMCYTVWCS